MNTKHSFTGYDPAKSYEWNYEHVPEVIDVDVPAIGGNWQFCGLPVASPLGIPAGPLLNGGWCRYYANLGFDVLTYKTVRSVARECYPMPNLQPVASNSLADNHQVLAASQTMQGSWAVSFGMPSRSPQVWRADVETTRRLLPSGKRLVVSVVGTIQPGWKIDDLAADYAQCAAWAIDAGADAVEANFSCPNVSTRDGQLDQSPDDARLVAEHLRHSVGNKPLVIKIGYIRSRDIAESLVESLAGLANGISMVNCIRARIVAEDGSEMFSGEQRGIGGEAILDASVRQLRMICEIVRQRGVSLELIGVGGVHCTRDVIRFLEHGAAHVQLATAVMLDPLAGIHILREMSGSA